MGQEGLRECARRRETRGWVQKGVGEAVRGIGDVIGARTDRQVSCANS